MASDPSNECYGRGIQYIRRWCRTSGHLPSAFILIDPVDHASLKRRSQTALSDVYMGSSGGKAIAVKAVRLLEENRAQIKEVRAPLVMLGALRGCSRVCRPVSIISLRSRSLAIPQAPKHCSFPGSNDVQGTPFLPRQRVDGGGYPCDVPPDTPSRRSPRICECVAHVL
jgi:hypothetical protein